MAAALSAALETKLLAALLETSRSAADHARALGLDPRATERVLDVLVAYDIAARTGDAFGASETFASWTRSLPGGQMLLPMWAHTPEFLRTGKPFIRMDGADKARYVNVVGGLGKMMDGAARDLAARLTLPAPPARILDVGCGSGVWSLAIAARYPGARVTGLDRADVLDAFRARAAEEGLAERIAMLPGDVETVAIPREYDLVIVANVLRLYEPERARPIVLHATAGLKAGGTLLVVDALAGGTPERERARASYALHLAMRTEQGRVYSPATVTEWMTAAGIIDCALITLDTGPGAVGAIAGRAC
jgi:2-polyprenyl-3-methyl-5-hydroxy-6-metoxy-1,4-benzoquinol methylase